MEDGRVCKNEGVKVMMDGRAGASKACDKH